MLHGAWLLAGLALSLCGCAGERPQPAVHEAGVDGVGLFPDLWPADHGATLDSNPYDWGGAADGPSPSGPFPVSYDKSAVVLLSSDSVTVGGDSYLLHVYRNPTYRCGKQGYFTFLVVERVADKGKQRPLWVLLHGGGVGYFDPGGTYVGSEERLDEEPGSELVSVLTKHVVGSAGIKQTVAGNRLKEGWRFLVPSMCDHDLYAGMGNPYPHDPYWPGNPDTVDGLLATMAAVDFTARGNGTLGGYATSLIVVHGTSAGSAGAYHVAHAFERNGVHLNGALLDAYLVSARVMDLFGTGCTPQEQTAKQRGLTFDFKQVEQKLGAFAADQSLFAEQTVGQSHSVPLFDLVGSGDGQCCGGAAPVPAAKAAGYSNNCRYVHGLLQQRMQQQPAAAHMRQLVVEINKHVLTPLEGAYQGTIESWVQAILADSPKAPW